MSPGSEAVTVDDFCAAHSISPSHYYEQRKAGHGPREMRVGRSVRISKEAAAEWRRQREGAPGSSYADDVAGDLAFDAAREDRMGGR